MTIDSLHSEVLALKKAVAGSETMRPARVRAVWRKRQRPFWRLEPALYEGMAKRLAALGENFLVMEVVAESRRFFGETPQMTYLEALALARAGSPQRCLEILLERRELLAGIADAPALRARICKDGWKATGDSRLLEESLRHYLHAYRESNGDPFPGINAASMSLLAGRADEARSLAAEVRERLGSPRADEDYWAAVTRAECSLVLGDIETSRDQYRTACGGLDVPKANLVTTRAQARLLLASHGCPPRDFDAVFSLPNIACFTGHRIDDPDRATPRFPASAAPAVAARLRELLSAANISLGFSSAAQGGDILFAEAIRASPGGETNIFIPGDREAFRHASVSMKSDPSWDQRFDQTLAEADEVTDIEIARGDIPQPVDFDYCNRLCLGAAMFRARELDSELTLVALWDGRPGPRGGTSDAVRLARRAGLNVEVIDPLQPSAVNVSSIEPEVPAGERNLFSIVVVRVGSGAVPSDLGKAQWVVWDQPLLTGVFASTHDAVSAAKSLLSSGAVCDGRVGLHFAPLEFLSDPLKSATHPGGIHLRRARELHQLCLKNSVCASAEFAAAARLENAGAEFEYLGSLGFGSSSPERQVYRLTSRRD